MKDTDNYAHLLKEALERVEAELRTIAIYDLHADNWEAIPEGTSAGDADENSEADVVEEWNERRATTAVLETDYRNLKRALQKITDGTYGICEVSGEAIEQDRLKVNPSARTCTLHMNEEGSLSL